MDEREATITLIRKKNKNLCIKSEGGVESRINRLESRNSKMDRAKIKKNHIG